MKNYDLVIIGGGPGGYVSAIRGAKEGLAVALITGGDIGGTCLNRGCIPSKTFLKHAELIKKIQTSEQLGIKINDFTYSIKDMVKRKNEVVNNLKNGVNSLLKQNKINVYQGYGYVNENKSVIIKSSNSSDTIQGENIILANGSRPFIPDIPGISNTTYETSDTIFDKEEAPNHMVIVGGGVIGLEIACIFSYLGTSIEVIEMAEHILPGEDQEASSYLKKELENKNIVIRTNNKITEFSSNDNKKIVRIESMEKSINSIETDCILMATGRTSNLTGLENIKVDFVNDFLKVDNNLQTSIKGIYAIGDLIGGYQLAHAASSEGISVINYIVGKHNNNYQKKNTIPRCVYTFPEVASVGLTEIQAKEAGYKVKVKTTTLAANGKAITANETSGFMKLVAEEQFGEILGVVMVGANTTEMISQASAFMHLEGTVVELDTLVFPHPTISENLGEAGSAWMDLGIHYI